MTRHHLLINPMVTVLGILKLAPSLVQRMRLLLLDENEHPAVGGKGIGGQPEAISRLERHDPMRAEEGSISQPAGRAASSRGGAFAILEEKSASPRGRCGIVDLKGFERIQARLSATYVQRKACSTTAV
jgi:hypothetical protein